MELPPRARRIPIVKIACETHHRTTSACAENTTSDLKAAALIGNYLRVRGEYSRSRLTVPMSWELPPRARRIRVVDIDRGKYVGTTSACAENTSQSHQRSTPARNYLRVRGEYNLILVITPVV